MDDRAPAYGGRGDGDVEEPQATPRKWSCVDYVDMNVARDVSTENRRDPKAPEKGSDGLRRRFGEIAGHDQRVGDDEGTCREIGVTRWGNSRRVYACGQRRAMRIVMFDGEDDNSATETKQWWEGKRTNHGWPGTAEGRINTAQGMAGDLVSNLDSEEKSDVAGILTRTVSELRW